MLTVIFHSDGFRISDREENRTRELLNLDVQSHNERRENLHCTSADVFDDSAKHVPSVTSVPSSDTLSLLLLRASATLAASDALSQELLDVRSPSAADSMQCLSTPQKVTPHDSPTPSQFFAKQTLSPAAFVSEDRASDASSSSPDKSVAVVQELHSNLSTQSPKLVIATARAKEDFSSELLLMNSMPTKSAPVVLLRRGSSNSSSSSHNGERLNFHDDSVISRNHAAHADPCLEQSVGKVQRLKLRSRIGDIRPSSADRGVHRSVRPDLASGLGFRAIHTGPVKVSASDADRVSLSGSRAPLCFNIISFY